MKTKKREQIIIAARDCFSKYGYKKTTLEDIGQKIGLNKASIYYYFKNKQEIYMTIVLQDFRMLVSKLYSEIDNAIEEEMECDKKILIYFEKRHQWWAKQSSLLPQVTLDDVHKFIEIASPIKNKIEQEERKNFSKILKMCIARKQIQKCDVEEVSRFIFALTEGIRSIYRDVDTMRPLTIEESENINQDTQKALKVFLKGLKNIED